MDNLPILYYTNRNVWKTSEIFKKRLKSWDVDVQRKARMVLLLLNKSAPHTHLHSLKNNHLEALGPVTVHLEQSVKREKTNKMQQLDVYYQLLSQHVSGIIMPIFRRTKTVLLHMVYCSGSARCGW